MSRYQSRYRWQKINTGYYESRDGQWQARRLNDGYWHLFGHVSSDNLPYDWLRLSSHLSLADCQEIAAKSERDKWTTV